MNPINHLTINRSSRLNRSCSNRLNRSDRNDRSNRLKIKKGSLVLSFLASGVVAFTIVAAHQTTRRFVVGAGQGTGYHSAFSLAQDALGLASLMVSRNIILCKDEKQKSANHTPKILQNKGCSVPSTSSSEPSTYSIDDDAWNFFENHLKLEQNLLTSQDGGSRGKSVTLKNLPTNSKSPFYEFLRKGGEIKWSLTNWNQDSSISTIFSAMGQGICRDATTFKVKEEYTCDAFVKNGGVFNANSIEYFKNTPIKCQNSSGDPEDGTICDYFQLVDNDSNVVFIEVTIPFVESSESGATRSQKMIINGAVRRPIAILSVLNGDSGNPVCSVRCEASEIVTEGLTELQPPCAGISDYGADVVKNIPSIPNNPEARSSLIEVAYNFKVKNYGPGVVHDLELYREDFRRTNEVGANILLSEEVVPAQGTDEVKILPNGILEIQDTVPCYDTSYYRVSVDQNACGGCYCVGSMFLEDPSNPGQAGQRTIEECTDMVEKGLLAKVFEPRGFPGAWVNTGGLSQELRDQGARLCETTVNINSSGGNTTIQSSVVSNYCAMGEPGTVPNDIDVCDGSADGVEHGLKSGSCGSSRFVCDLNETVCATDAEGNPSSTPDFNDRECACECVETTCAATQFFNKDTCQCQEETRETCFIADLDPSKGVFTHYRTSSGACRECCPGGPNGVTTRDAVRGLQSQGYCLDFDEEGRCF